MKDPRKLFAGDLARSGLSVEEVERVGWKLVPPTEFAKLFPRLGQVHAYQIPYPRKHRQGLAPVSRYRLLTKPVGAFGQVDGKAPKYLQPKGTLSAAFFHAPHSWDACLAGNGEIILVEGEKKAVAGCRAGFNVVGLGGVWSWKSKALAVSLIPELEAISWTQRVVYICFDSDAKTNPDVARAILALCVELTSRGARVAVATMPDLEGCEKVGLDDFLVKRGAESFRRYLDVHADFGEMAAKLWAFNERFCVVQHPPFIVDNQATDDNGKRTYKMMDPGKFVSCAFANINATEVTITASGEERSKQVCVAEKWMKWPCRRQVEGLTYAPGEPEVTQEGSRLNTWRGLGVEPKKGSVKPWKDLLDYMFKGAPREHRDWFERWVGYPLANLGAKLSSAVGIWGLPGRGKSLIAEKTLAPIYGANFCSISQVDFEDDYNDWCVGKSFVLVDEVSASDSRTRANRFKKLVTQTHAQVNIKYIPRYAVPDHLNYYLTSNSPKAFYVEDHDRRFFIHRAPDDSLPREFFRHYVEDWIGYKNGMGLGPGAPALLHYFLEQLDFGDFDPAAPPPMTEDKEEMIEIGRHPAEDWLLHFVHSDLYKQLDAREVFSLHELCAYYRATGPSGSNGMAPNTMGSHLRSICWPRARVRVGGELVKLVAVKSFDKWIAKIDDNDAWRDEYTKGQKGRKF